MVELPHVVQTPTSLSDGPEKQQPDVICCNVFTKGRCMPKHIHPNYSVSDRVREHLIQDSPLFTQIIQSVRYGNGYLLIINPLSVAQSIKVIETQIDFDCTVKIPYQTNMS